MHPFASQGEGSVFTNQQSDENDHAPHKDDGPPQGNIEGLAHASAATRDKSHSSSTIPYQ